MVKTWPGRPGEDLNFAPLMLKTIGFCALIPALLSSCEKAINFKPHDASAAVVVEASIENSKYPVVILSQSQDYFSSISPGQLDSSFIHGADVSISNGTITSQL